jgi:DNA-binding MarR family transcriptional regulator
MTGQQGRDEDVRLRAWTDFVLSYNRLMAVLEREMQDGTGITLSQYDVLLRLAEAPGHRLKMTELAQAIVYSTGGLTRLFERMRQAGLVRREPSEHDRRVIYAVLTNDGLERLRAASAVHLAGVRRHFAAQLADDEADVVAAFLGRLHESTLTCDLSLLSPLVRYASRQGGYLPSARIRTQLVLTWKLHGDVGPGPGSAAELERAAQRLDAVGEAGQARSARGISPADTVVADGQQQTAAARGE